MCRLCSPAICLDAIAAKCFVFDNWPVERAVGRMSPFALRCRVPPAPLYLQPAVAASDARQMGTSRRIGQLWARQCNMEGSSASARLGHRYALVGHLGYPCPLPSMLPFRSAKTGYPFGSLVLAKLDLAREHSGGVLLPRSPRGLPCGLLGSHLRMVANHSRAIWLTLECSIVGLSLLSVRSRVLHSPPSKHCTQATEASSLCCTRTRQETPGGAIPECCSATPSA